MNDFQIRPATEIDFNAMWSIFQTHVATGETCTHGPTSCREDCYDYWFGAGAHILELCSVSTGRVSQREHVAYRMRVRRSGGEHLVEQQAYYSTEGGRITWMRVLCSGYQPVQQEDLAAR